MFGIKIATQDRHRERRPGLARHLHCRRLHRRSRPVDAPRGLTACSVMAARRPGDGSSPGLAHALRLLAPTDRTTRAHFTCPIGADGLLADVPQILAICARLSLGPTSRRRSAWRCTASTSTRSRSTLVDASDLLVVPRRSQVRHDPARVDATTAGRAAMRYGLTAKLRVVQPALEALPPETASIELPHTAPVVPVVGEAGSGLAPA